MKTFGQRFKVAMQSCGYSQNDIARELGTYPANISHWVNGINSPTAVSVNKILRLMPEIDARWLLTGEGREPVRRRMTHGEMSGHCA